MKLEIELKTDGIEAFVFRVFDEKNQQIYYNSSRLAGVTILHDRVSIEVPDTLSGKDYELKAIPTLQVISKGKVTVKKWESIPLEEYPKNSEE